MGGAGGLKNEKKHEKLGKMKNRPFMTVYPVVVSMLPAGLEKRS